MCICICMRLVHIESRASTCMCMNTCTHARVDAMPFERSIACWSASLIVAGQTYGCGWPRQETGPLRA